MGAGLIFKVKSMFYNNLTQPHNCLGLDFIAQFLGLSLKVSDKTTVNFQHTKGCNYLNHKSAWYLHLFPEVISECVRHLALHLKI